ncbi:MAG: hypothetical protein JWO11_1094 [Nocardioides sp.]|nr:hypothetical protein [Nocardioides sp.]
MPRPSLARRERHDLCDLALTLGEDAPTLCGGWDAKDLVTHLLVRENRPVAGLGIAVPALSGLADREMARVGRRDFAVLVEKLRDPGLTPYAIKPLERVLNTLEFFVHHEDLRRAQEGWQPRTLDPADEQRLWSAIRGGARLAVRKAGVAVRIRRSDVPTESATVRRGAGPVTVTGLPSELALFFFGRDRTHGLAFDGPPAAVAKLRTAELGF